MFVVWVEFFMICHLFITTHACKEVQRWRHYFVWTLAEKESMIRLFWLQCTRISCKRSSDPYPSIGRYRQWPPECCPSSTWGSIIIYILFGGLYNGFCLSPFHIYIYIYIYIYGWTIVIRQIGMCFLCVYFSCSQLVSTSGEKKWCKRKFSQVFNCSF